MMAPNFLKNFFGPPKRTSKQGQEDDEVPQIPPERKLSLSKSGKMRRKNYTRQKSVTDESVYKNPSNDNKASGDNSVISNFVARESITRPHSENSIGEDLNIEEVVQEMMQTAQTTRL